MGIWRIDDPKTHGSVLDLQEHQAEFVQSDAYATFLAGGWGSGKSFALLAWMSVMAYINPGCDGILVMPTYQLLKTFLRTQLLPAFKPIMLEHLKGEQVIRLPGNRNIIHISGNHTERLESYNAAWVAIDEAGLCDRDIFARAAARVRVGNANRLGIGLTGVPIWGWLKDEFEGRNDKDRRIIHASTFDNERLHPDAARLIRESCPARDAQSKIRGFFVPPGGNVYPGLDIERHTVRWQYNPNMESGVCIDWGTNKPAVSFVQLLPSGHRIKNHVLTSDGGPAGAVIFDELNPKGPITTQRFCEQIKAKGHHIDFMVCDPAGKAKQSTSGVDDITIAKRVLGVRRVYATTNARLRSIPVGVDHVNRMLDPVSGPARLYFADHLPNNRDPRGVWNSLIAYSYPEEKDGRPTGDDPLKDGVTDHQCDLVRYLCTNLFPVVRLQTRVRSMA